MSTEGRRGHWQWGVAVGLALLLRVWLLWRYGILEWPDSGGYVGAAQQILNFPSLLDALSGNVAFSGFRTIGYPLVLAGAMAVAGSAWPWAAVGFQIALLVCMLWWLYRLGLALGLSRGMAAFATGVFACSHLAIYEGSILTDAVTTHLTVIAIALPLVPLLEDKPVGFARCVGAGLLLAYAFLIREATLYLIPVVVLALVIVCVARRRTVSDLVRIVACFVLPCLLVWQAYLEWTEVRTGYRAMASVGQSVYLMHPLEIERDGKRVLDEPRLREAADATSSSYIYGHALEINSYLNAKFGLTEWERAELSKAAYWHAWRVAPAAMAIEALKELRPKHAVRLADISANFIDLNVTVEMTEVSMNSKSSSAAKLIQIVFRAFSAVIFAGCVIGIPLYVLVPRLRRSASGRLEGLAACWLVFSSLVGMYAMIHMEFRHVLPVQAFAVLSGIAMLSHIVTSLGAYLRDRKIQTMR
jgi:hypothetical protein